MTSERRIRIDLEYHGARYAGWQWQDNAISIQQVAEEALEKLTGQKTRITASGRTDAGVHAILQPTHADVTTNIPDSQLLRGMNALLPEDVAAKSVSTVPKQWDARRSAVRKTYRYVILNRELPSVFGHGRQWHIRHHLDAEKMAKAAEHLLGERDFSSFRSSGCASTSPVRKISLAEVVRDGEMITMTFTGSGFLKQMVRNMVGTLAEVGRGKLAPEAMKDILEARDRKAAGPCAPPEGLWLVDVEY